MKTRLKVYTNEDDALLFWGIDAPIQGCRGFALERRKTDRQGKKTQGFLANRIGFENERVRIASRPGQEAVTKPSSQWPFQRFSWTDHDADSGDAVSYRAIPVIRDSAGKLELVASWASDWSPERTLGAAENAKFKPFFNRGFVMSQFMARYLAQRKLSLAQFKKTISDKDDKTIRGFLSGDLRLALLEQLELARKQKTEVYAALFELSDDELVAALCELGKNAHVVLSNGSITPKKGETAAQARKRDENAAARLRLKNAGVDVEDDSRFLSPGALGHNKFLVRLGKDGKPLVAWTGSTNWAPTGLCTQVNNGLLVEDPEVANIYFKQWELLREAKSAFTPELVAANNEPKKPETLSGCRVWFTRSEKGVDLKALREEVARAREGILFLMFMPGAKGLFSDVSARAQEPGLYVRGVVSTLPNPKSQTAVDVSLVDGAHRRDHSFSIVQPDGVRHPFAHFAAEVTRQQFLAGVGHAIIHSKVVVIDPFSSEPAVITGSHNFSDAASSKNDENFVIVRGDRALAEAYSVNILGAYAHYRWRAYLGETNKPFNGLKDDDAWQAAKLAAGRLDLKFWGVR